MPAPGSVFSCFKCGTVVPLPAGYRVGLRDTCPKCDADLHACKNCRCHSPGAHNDCIENQADWVRYKEEGNKCDWFQPRLAEARGADKVPSAADDVRKKFDDLFKL